MKDTTPDYAERRGLEAGEMNAGRGDVNAFDRDPITRFKKAQQEFIHVAGIADLDPRAKARADVLCEEMKSASLQIAKDPVRMRAAEGEGIAPQIMNFVRQAERNRGRGRDRGLDRDEGFGR